MPANTKQEETLNLFLDNTLGDITAEDMRIYVDNIWGDKERDIQHFTTLQDVLISPVVYAGDLLTVREDTSNNGLYLSLVNQPTQMTDLVLISNISKSTHFKVNTILERDSLAAAQGDTCTVFETAQTYIFSDIWDEIFSDISVQNAIKDTITALDGLWSSTRTKLEIDIARQEGLDLNTAQDIVISNKSNVDHTHTTGDISDLEDLLNDKSDIDHLHTGLYEPANISIVNHLSNINNPHKVTKYIIALGSVDNTSDISKPISALTQAAIDGKSDNIHTHTQFDIITSNTMLINTNISSISGLTASVNINSDNISSLETSVSSNSLNINLMNGKVNTNTQKIDANIILISDINATLDIQSADISENIINISANTDAIQLSNSNIGINTTNISQNTSDINTNKTAIALNTAKATGADRILRSGDIMTGALKGIIPLDNDDLTRKDYVDTLNNNQNIIIDSKADESSVQSRLDTKAWTDHPHLIADIQDLQVELDAKVDLIYVDAENGAQDIVINSKADEASVQIRLDDKARLSHAHIINDIVDLQTSLDFKADITYVNDENLLQDTEIDLKADESSVQNRLDGKAWTNHGHLISEVQNLQGYLDSKANITLVDTKFDKIGGTITGIVTIDSGTASEAYLKVSRGTNSATINDDYFELSDGINDFNIIRDVVNGGVDVKINDATIVTFESGLAPMTPLQPTDTNHLTRKDYVDGLVTKYGLESIGLTDADLTTGDALASFTTILNAMSLESVLKIVYDGTTHPNLASVAFYGGGYIEINKPKGLVSANNYPNTFFNADATGNGQAYSQISLDGTFRGWNWNLKDDDLVDIEANLGVPGTDGFVLSSTIAGVRTWVDNTVVLNKLNSLADLFVSKGLLTQAEIDAL